MGSLRRAPSQRAASPEGRAAGTSPPSCAFFAHLQIAGEGAFQKACLSRHPQGFPLCLGGLPGASLWPAPGEAWPLFLPLPLPQPWPLPFRLPLRLSLNPLFLRALPFFLHFSTLIPFFTALNPVYQLALSGSVLSSSGQGWVLSYSAL